MEELRNTMLSEWREKSRDLFTAEGKPRTGARHRNAFWDGFRGDLPPALRPAANTLAAQCYNAGRDARKESDQTMTAPCSTKECRGL